MTTNTAFEAFVDSLRNANCNPRPVNGSQWQARCPAHDDKSPSLSIKPVVGKFLLYCQAGCARPDVLGAVNMRDADMWDEPLTKKDRDPTADGGTWMPCGHVKVASYRYHDSAGNLVFGVARCDRKGNGCQGFRQWRPEPASKSGRKWSLALPDGTKVGEGLPYRLPEVLAELRSSTPRVIYIPEGEKDVDRFWSMGHPATCCAQGAGKWTPGHAQWLEGADVIVVADRDEPGWRHAEQVVNSLMDLAASIEVVRAAKGKDASDHFDAGLKLIDLITVAEPKAAPAIGPDGSLIYATAGAR